MFLHTMVCIKSIGIHCVCVCIFIHASHMWSVFTHVNTRETGKELKEFVSGLMQRR